MKLSLMALVAVVLVGCQDTRLPASIEAAADRAKAAISGNRLPEESSEAAITNHGYVTLLKWAEGGDAKAQHFVAVANLVGNAVPKNFEAARKWALRAANQGTASSQFMSGMIRSDAAIGSDLLAVEPNLVRAYMWFSLAAAQGHNSARNELARIEPAMDPRWVRKAQQLSADWRRCATKDCQDHEPDLVPLSHCKDRPGSVLCP
jgi:uncharacterized protein